MHLHVVCSGSLPTASDVEGVTRNRLHLGHQLRHAVDLIAPDVDDVVLSLLQESSPRDHLGEVSDVRELPLLCARPVYSQRCP